MRVVLILSRDVALTRSGASYTSFAVSHRIWIRFDLPPEGLAALRAAIPGCDFRHGDDAAADADWLQEVDGVFSEEPLPDELCRRMDDLKWLHVTRGGVNAYLTAEIKRRPIQVTSSKGIHGEPFSEFALACIFALAKRLPQCWQAQRERQWQRLIPESVEGKTLGIVGLGTIGMTLAQKAHSLGFRIIATKRTVNGKPDFVNELGGSEFLPALLHESDFVVLSLASVPSTVDIIGETELRLMKQSAYLINLTGGKAIEERVLVRALKERWIAGAALDALPRQPLPDDSELWHLSNVIITPRIGGITSRKWNLLLPIFTENLRRFVAGEPLQNVVNKDVGY
jgi:phosphoglycerate dehydrogenase-like enzyme